MRIIHLTHKEQLAYCQLRSMAWQNAIGEKELAQLLSHPDPDPRRWGALSEDGTLAAGLTCHDFRAFLQGETVYNGGIGGVVTHPAYRRQGAIREIFTELLRETRSNGEILSTLYPFSHAFYRKFGYELCDGRVRHTLPLAGLGRIPFEGWARLLVRGDGGAQYEELYARFARRYNLMLATPPQSDAATRFSEPFKGGDFAYNYLIGEGSRPLAFVRFSRNPHDTMDVQEAFFDGYEGLNALLGYLARFTAEFATIAITLPRGVPLSSLVENPYALKSAPEHSYMARVTNAAAALALLRPEEPFTVEVCDQFLPENSGVYRVSAEGAQREAAAPDIRLSEHALAQLVTGFVPIGQLAARRDVRAGSDPARLARALCVREPYIMTHF